MSYINHKLAYASNLDTFIIVKLYFGSCISFENASTLTEQLFLQSVLRAALYLLRGTHTLNFVTMLLPLTLLNLQETF